MEGEIRKAIREVLDELQIGDVDFAVEHPSELSHGDYATNVALVAAKTEHKGPHELAFEIIPPLEKRLENVATIETAGPGFINFFLNRKLFKEVVSEVNALGDDWGKNKSLSGKKVIVEYTDPNPFKEFHIGHLFTNTVGESIARLFMMQGGDVRRVNYQGDVGMHVACAVWGLKQLGASGDALDVKTLGKAYAKGAKAYEEDEGAEREIRDINKAIYEKSDEELGALYDRGRRTSLAYFESIYALLGTAFDQYFFESEVADIGKELVLNNKDVFEESDGAYVFRGEKYGLHTRVFLNKEGLPTYEAKELALAKTKYDYCEYDLSIVSTSSEINEYFKVLKKAMSFVYPELAERTEHIGHGTVRLATGKMSSRTGDVIPALDFIDEIAEAVLKKMNGTSTPANDDLARDIAIGAIKYATLKGSIFQDSVFNKEQALSFEGDSGPYLMYTHARIESVKEKAREAGIQARVDMVPEAPYEIEKFLYRFPEIVEAASRDREPHQVTVFLTELAGAFNSFYAHERIVDTADEYAPYKLALAEAVQTTLKNGLWILGIKAPLRM